MNVKWILPRGLLLLTLVCNFLLIGAPLAITALEMAWRILQLVLFGVALRHARSSDSMGSTRVRRDDGAAMVRP
jgi:hypothetical protein